jgi:hypothetical protein
LQQKEDEAPETVIAVLDAGAGGPDQPEPEQIGNGTLHRGA